MCFVRANSDFLFWQNLTPTKKKKKTNQTPPPSWVTVMKQLHYLTCLFGIRVGSAGKRDQLLLRLPGGSMLPAATDTTWPRTSFCNILPTARRIILHAFQARFSRPEKYFLCFKGFTGEITQPVVRNAFLSSV